MCKRLTLPASVRNSLEDKYMLFNHFYITQEQELEAWFVSPESRKYFDVKPTTIMSTN